MKCICCKIKIITLASKKYCDNCSLHTLEIRHKNSSLKYQINKLKKELYGYEDGRQRLR